MRYYIIRREEPFEKGTEEYYGDEDEFTLGCKMVFVGLVYNFIGPKTISFPNEILLCYDVVKDIKSNCYVRDQVLEPGSITDSWREPTLEEYENVFIEIIKEEYLKNSVYLRDDIGNDITDDLVYKEYLSKKRDTKLNELGI